MGRRYQTSYQWLNAWSTLTVDPTIRSLRRTITAERPRHSPTNRVRTPDVCRAPQLDFGFVASCLVKGSDRYAAPTFHIRGTLPEGIPQHAAGESFDLGLIETNAAGVEHWTQARHDLEAGNLFDFANVSPAHYLVRLRGPHKNTAFFPSPSSSTIASCRNPRSLRVKRSRRSRSSPG